jgi:hypothetical protein
MEHSLLRRGAGIGPNVRAGRPLTRRTILWIVPT